MYWALFFLPALLLCGGQSVLPAQSKGTHSTASAEDGQVVFQHTCVMCHSTQPGVKIVGPSLASVLRGPHANQTHAVREIVLNGKGKMPAEKGKLSDQQIADLLAYLRTL